jgi:uncharacterized protein (TIGR02246 family)
MKVFSILRIFPGAYRKRESQDSPGLAGKSRGKLALAAILLMGICLAPLWSWADQDEALKQEIIQVMRELAQAYNQNQSEVLQGHFTETADVVTLPGQKPTQGPEQVVRHLLQSRSQDYLNGKMEIQVQNIKFFDKDWALVEAKNILQGVTSPRGAKLPPIEHFMLLLMEKNKKKWRIESMRYFSRFPILRPLNRPGGPS